MTLMKKRLLVSSIWFYGAWTAAAGTAYLFGWNGAIAPVVGLLAGVVVWFDPKHVMWPRAAHAPKREPAVTQEPVRA